jgi:hypothetical protein
MITHTQFEKIVKSITNYNTVGCKEDEDIIEVESKYNKNILSAHQYIEENKISNNESLYKVFFKFACEHSSIYYFWDEYLMNNRDHPTIEEYVNKKFVKNADKSQSFTNIKYFNSDFNQETVLVIVTLRKILLAVGKPAGFPYHPIPLI